MRFLRVLDPRVGSGVICSFLFSKYSIPVAVKAFTIGGPIDTAFACIVVIVINGIRFLFYYVHFLSFFTGSVGLPCVTRSARWCTLIVLQDSFFVFSSTWHTFLVRASASACTGSARVTVKSTIEISRMLVVPCGGSACINDIL